jgi:multidrug efflux pump subunit AcrA (membrane-fusion protein)
VKSTLLIVLYALFVLLCSCVRDPVRADDRKERDYVPSPSTLEPGAGTRVVRITGTVQATKALAVRVPQIAAQNSRLTLVSLIPNGSKVQAGDLLAEFDATSLIDEDREAKGKLSELIHQLAERKAKARSDAAKRSALLVEAEADLAKARIQLRKGPILSDIDRKKNETLSESAQARVESLTKSNRLHDLEEEAAIGVLEKKVERQNLRLERLANNMDRLSIKSPHAGMIALETVWRSGSMGPPQEGDLLNPGQPVLRIFDPGAMVVEGTISEADVSALAHAAEAKVYLDAYPGATFDARLESASPVATAGLDTPVRNFSARFRILQQDPRLLPDLSASLEIVIPAKEKSR